MEEVKASFGGSGRGKSTSHDAARAGGAFASTRGGRYVRSEPEAMGSPSIRLDPDDPPCFHPDSLVEPNVRALWRLLYGGIVGGDSDAPMHRAPLTVAAAPAPMKTPTEPSWVPSPFE